MKCLYKVQRVLLCILILLLPYHSMASYIIGDSIPLYKFWKEAIICIMFCVFLYQIIYDYIKNKKIYKPNLLEIILICFLIIVSIYIFTSENIFRSIYIGRIYVLPILMVPVIKNMDIDFIFLKKLFIGIMINTVILCLWGIFQCLVLGDDFLMNIGYAASTKWGPLRLNDEFYLARLGDFQRLSSTFAAPNTCGIYLSIVLILSLFVSKKIQINKVLLYFANGLIFVSLVLTFSRTSWIALLVALSLYMWKFYRFDKNKTFFTIKVVCSLVLILAVIDGIFFTFDITVAIIHLVYSTLNGSDSSVNGHINSLIISVEKLIDNPLGLGMGKNGQRALVFMKKPNLTESAYFLMMYEVGILGGIVYFSTFIKTIYDNIKSFWLNNQWKLLISSVMLIMLTGFLSLPYVQDFELLVYAFILMALNYNKNFAVETIYSPKED